MNKPDTQAILSQLKDFQRETVDYAFGRMYDPVDPARRFLVADEVGLGKTLIARGIIARVIEKFWETDRRIDIIYICSNADIARQNINRLNVTGRDDYALASRITLLPMDPKLRVEQGRENRLNFVSFTPGTSFHIQGGSGWAPERVLLYWMLHKAWGFKGNAPKNVLQGYSRSDSFRRQIDRFNKEDINPSIASEFTKRLNGLPGLREEFENLCGHFSRSDANISKDQRLIRERWVGKLRQVLAQSCLHSLEPDLIILDEFQRFKDLMAGDSEAANLARDLFDYQQDHTDLDSAARVLLLSATPYKMYTRSHESEQDDHYADFRRTLDFLQPDLARRTACQAAIKGYREALFHAAEHEPSTLVAEKSKLEAELRRVMVRTERLAVSDDRNGMLVHRPSEGLKISTTDVEQYLTLQNIARALQHHDVVEYWKSAPYLLNFMENYQLKRKLNDALEATKPDPELQAALRRGKSAFLDVGEIQRYDRIDPGNARLAGLLRDTVDRGAWRMLWIPPTWPYYQGDGPYAEPELANFTKRLVFSSWRVAPKAIASVLSYEAERKMYQQFRPNAKNTAAARKKRRPLLRFAKTKGRLTGMPVMAMVYPSLVLAEIGDPWKLSADFRAQNKLPGAFELFSRIRKQISDRLKPLEKQIASDARDEDERWYWLAPLLLDRQEFPEQTRDWFGQTDLAHYWAGENPKKSKATNTERENRGWQEHVEQASKVAKSGEIPAGIGKFPSNLILILSMQALGGPGVCMLRTLLRTMAQTPHEAPSELRNAAAAAAMGLRQHFNVPEVTASLRDQDANFPYWRSVLQYCIDGNLQAVLDEYAHILHESEGLIGISPDIASRKIALKMREALTIRTSTAQADIVRSKKGQIGMSEQKLRMRTRFAMRFGDQTAEDTGEATREDQVRIAFNSPFWPFVLATTSVGQEGLDFHPYCHAVVHWNLPSNPVDLEQREGRVHRYKGHALRKNIVEHFGAKIPANTVDSWSQVFQTARSSRAETENDLFPYWISPNGTAKIERHVPALPLSRDARHYDDLRKTLVLYRMVYGQNRQEDLVEYLTKHCGPEKLAAIQEACRIDLGPKIAAAAGHRGDHLSPTH